MPAASPSGGRCPVHGLALAPDGRCARCRGARRPSRGAGIGFQLAVAAAVVATAAVLGWLWWRYTAPEPRRPATAAERALERAADAVSVKLYYADW